MESILKSDIFFFITAMCVFVVTAIVIMILAEVLRIAKNVRRITDHIRQQADGVASDFSIMRSAVKEDLFKPVLGYLKKLADKITSPKKAKKRKVEKEEGLL